MKPSSSPAVWPQLVRMAQKGSIPAFDALVHRFRPAVFGVCLRRSSREEAEDITQSVFVQAFLHLHDLKDADRFPAWLHAIARNLSTKPKPPEEAGHDLDGLVVALSTTLSQRSWQRHHDRIDCQPLVAALLTLPEHLSSPAELVYLQGWSVREAAEFLGVTVTTVKWRLHEARQSLRQTFPNLNPTP